MLPNIDYLRKIIKYNPCTGNIDRLDRKNSNGSIDHYGYLILKIKGVQYKAHRIVWAIFYGRFPLNNIDHIDGNKLNNSIFNLRDVSQAENCKNQHVRNKDTGVVGVYLDNSTKGLKKKFTTSIPYNGKRKTFRFYTINEAKQFRIKNGYNV